MTTKMPEPAQVALEREHEEDHRDRRTRRRSRTRTCCPRGHGPPRARAAARRAPSRIVPSHMTDIAMLPARRPGSQRAVVRPAHRDGRPSWPPRPSRPWPAAPPAAAGARSRPFGGRERRSERDHRHRVRRHRAVHEVVAVRRQRDVDVHCCCSSYVRGFVVRSRSVPARCDVSASTSSDTVVCSDLVRPATSTTVAPSLVARHPHPDPAAAHQQGERETGDRHDARDQRQLLAGVARDGERRPLDVAVEGRRCRARRAASTSGRGAAPRCRCAACPWCRA